MLVFGCTHVYYEEEEKEIPPQRIINNMIKEGD
jgi:hypothetical protein